MGILSVIAIFIALIAFYSWGYSRGFDVGMKYPTLADYKQLDQDYPDEDMTWDEAVRRASAINVVELEES